ncbi:mycofactocin system glycosyltransferase [Gordonia pseudamarae]|uniref:Mycofactocin system glycosyltransferase n=1 Tax=Gordonia pseudamarae TaxID=2831662 RepID=A0ABX6IPL8_9ACTN|nr:MULTISPECIES: mycofactocin biosynthesis glycosyltransferase MftF [Gordonia]MBD0021108.1 mycofactocin biosynthesis glycosyltransferase MftF [Gordonia sp. (in: high G+C Gram-positive bacteria)]QHN28791.1 mycofactocin system glycosyltransferase [Gordonia pseudamarae]QHN37666.1 mycofactocin system glycosyltransferase [Gordonia pseudamarae]
MPDSRGRDDGVAAARTDLPDGFQVQVDLRCAQRGDLRYLVGGSPTRMLRLSEAALGMMSADGRIAVCDSATRTLCRRLLDAGIAHPRPMFGPSADQVTVVVPVRDNQEGIDRLIRTRGKARMIVVDDGSEPPITVHGDGVSVLRLDRNQGPAAARNAGAATATTDFVAFIDSDCVPAPDWLTMLLPHFSDPAVAITAPRIVGLNTRPGFFSLAARYENGYSSLDMGPAEAPVVPSTPMPYVPSAAIVLRRSAFPGFDESLRVAEDVDLCWRLHDAGWRLRYDPVARVAHEHRTGLRTVLDRRRFYGTGAAYLADRHERLAAPMVMSATMAAAVVALLTRTATGSAIALLLLGQMAVRLRRRLDGLPRAPLVAVQMTGRAAGFGLLQAGSAICRHYWPIALLPTLFSRRYRTLVVEVAIAEGLIDWVRRVISEPGVRPALGPVSYLVMRRLDDLAYGLGLWQGVITHRDAGALRPVLSK